MPARTAIILVLALFGLTSAGAQSEPDSRISWEGLQNPHSVIKRFVDPLTRQEHRPIRSVLTSDQEHASSIAPVLTPHSPIFIRTSQKRSPNLEDVNYVLEDGRVFMNYSQPYDSDKTPLIKIRPVDGKTRIPFVVRTYLTFPGSSNDTGTLDILIRLPVLFDPKVEIRGVMSGSRRLDYEMKMAPDLDSHTISIPLTLEEISASRRSGKPMEITVEGAVHLADYQVIGSDRFQRGPSDHPSRLRSIARLLPGRDYLGPEEKVQLEKLAAEISALAKDKYEQVVLSQRFVSNRISYFQNNMLRSAVQVLQEGMGDCDDFSRVMVALLRALNIPARSSVGFLYDFNSMGSHAWVEVALPMRNGRLHWFLCDPTLATASQDKDYFVQFKNRIYLYPVRFDVKAHNVAADQVTETLLNWAGREKDEERTPAALQSILNTFSEQLKASLEQKVTELLLKNLLLRRQFLFAPASSFVVTERPVVEQQSQLRTLLDDEERLVVELIVLDDDYSLDSAADQAVLQTMRNAYERLKKAPFEGSEARHCLELVYYRDRYTDRLQRVTLRMGRYLVEQHLRLILDAFQKEGLVAAPEVERMDTLYQTCSGKNLYHLQERARMRQEAAGVAREPGEPGGEPTPSRGVTPPSLDDRQ